jgi:hypothetical protein
LLLCLVSLPLSEEIAALAETAFTAGNSKISFTRSLLGSPDLRNQPKIKPNFLNNGAGQQMTTKDIK